MVARGWLGDGPWWFGGDPAVAWLCLGGGPTMVQRFEKKKLKLGK